PLSPPRHGGGGPRRRVLRRCLAPIQAAPPHVTPCTLSLTITCHPREAGGDGPSSPDPARAVLSAGRPGPSRKPQKKGAGEPAPFGSISSPCRPAASPGALPSWAFR